MLSIRSALAVILLSSVVVLGTALLSQYVGGLQPCELCLYERWPYDTVIVLSGAALVSRPRRFGRTVLFLAALLFVACAALSLYHVSVEQHWIAGPSACTGDLQANSPEALLRALQGRDTVQCDVVQWSFHGISLAGLNFAVSLALAGFSLWALGHVRTGGRR